MPVQMAKEISGASRRGGAFRVEDGIESKGGTFTFCSGKGD